MKYLCQFGNCDVEREAAEMISVHGLEARRTLRFCSFNHLLSYLMKNRPKPDLLMEADLDANKEGLIFEMSKKDVRKWKGAGYARVVVHLEKKV